MIVKQNSGLYMLKKIFFYLAIFVLPILAFGSTGSQYYYVSATDLSVSYLSNLFGTVGDVLSMGTSSPLVSKLFLYFNQGVYIFTAALLTYIVLSSVIATSNEGKFITDKFNSWILIRSGLAVSLLVPLASGYCMMQVIVMWAVTQGVGLANSLWSEAVYNISSAGAFGNIVFATGDEAASQANTQYSPNFTQKIAIGGTDPTNYSSTVESTTAFVPLNQVFRSAYCAYTVYNYDKAAANRNQAPAPSSSNYGFFTNNNGNICFGSRAINPDGSSDYNCQCGEYTFPSSIDSNDSPSFDGSQTQLYLTSFNNMYSISSLLYNYAISTYNNINENNNQNNLKADGSSVNMNNVCQLLSSSNTSTANCLPASTIYSYSNNYNSMIAQYQSNEINTTSTDDSCASWVNSAKEQGWIVAAAYYSDLVNMNNSQCSNNNSISGYQGFMPYNYALNTNIVNCTDAQNACKNLPCMTPASGYGTDTTTLCNIANLDLATQSNWNAFYNSSLSDNTSNLMNNLYGNKALSSSSSSSPLGLQYITSTMQTTSIETNPIESSTFDGYFNGMLSSFIQNFVVNIYEPGDVGYDLMTGGGARYVVNGTATLVSYVVGEILGIDVYAGASSSSIFSESTMSSGTPGTNGNCSSCASNVDYAGVSNSACFDTSGSIDSCINTNGYGMFGMASKYRNGLPFLDPLTSIATVGRNIMKYTISFQTNLISNIYTGLKNLAGDIIGGMIGAVAGLSLLGFMGAFKGSTIPYLLPAIQMIVEILFQAHLTILFTYLPLAIALTVIFLSVGLLLGMYLPFLPFIMFTSGVISWFISVVEAMAAAPLIAMGVTNPKGHELLGRSEQALILLLGVFVRPATMIIGFIGAISLSYASMYLLNLTFAYAFTEGLNSQLDNNSGYGIAVLGGFLYTIVYAYSCYAILSQTFSLIFQVPDKVLRWIGSPRDTTGRDALAMLGGAKSGVMDAGGKMAEEGGGGSMRKAQQNAPNVSGLGKLDYQSTARQSEESQSESSTAGDSGSLGDAASKMLPKSVTSVADKFLKSADVFKMADSAKGLDSKKVTWGAFSQKVPNSARMNKSGAVANAKLLAGSGAVGSVARVAERTNLGLQKMKEQVIGSAKGMVGADKNSSNLKIAALDIKIKQLNNPIVRELTAKNLEVGNTKSSIAQTEKALRNPKITPEQTSKLNEKLSGLTTKLGKLETDQSRLQTNADSIKTLNGQYTECRLDPNHCKVSGQEHPSSIETLVNSYKECGIIGKDAQNEVIVKYDIKGQVAGMDLVSNQKILNNTVMRQTTLGVNDKVTEGIQNSLDLNSFQFKEGDTISNDGKALTKDQAEQINLRNQALYDSSSKQLSSQMNQEISAITNEITDEPRVVTVDTVKPDPSILDRLQNDNLSSVPGSGDSITGGSDDTHVVDPNAATYKGMQAAQADKAAEEKVVEQNTIESVMKTLDAQKKAWLNNFAAQNAAEKGK